MIATMTALGSPAIAHAQVPDPPQPDAIGDNEFLPDDADLSDCVGLVERPGCGSEQRGGNDQILLFAVLMAGMAVVFGRVFWAMRKGSRDEHGSPTA